LIRLVAITVAVLAIAVGQAEAQQGVLRPSQCAPSLGFKATIMVHGNPAPNFPVVLSTLGGNAPNARWHLQPAGDRFSIVSFFTQYGTVAMTVTGGGAQGSAIIVSPWTQSAEQLWTVDTDGSRSPSARRPATSAGSGSRRCPPVAMTGHGHRQGPRTDAR
jgi:hypothetical protein